MRIASALTGLAAGLLGLCGPAGVGAAAVRSPSGPDSAAAGTTALLSARSENEDVKLLDWKKVSLEDMGYELRETGSRLVPDKMGNYIRNQGRIKSFLTSSLSLTEVKLEREGKMEGSFLISTEAEVIITLQRSFTWGGDDLMWQDLVLQVYKMRFRQQHGQEQNPKFIGQQMYEKMVQTLDRSRMEGVQDQFIKAAAKSLRNSNPGPTRANLVVGPQEANWEGGERFDIMIQDNQIGQELLAPVNSGKVKERNFQLALFGELLADKWTSTKDDYRYTLLARYTKWKS